MNSIAQPSDGSEEIISFDHTSRMALRRPYEGEKMPINAPLAGIKMIFFPSLTRTIAELEKFEDLDVDDLRRSVRAFILDVHGTLTSDGDFAPAVVEKLREMRAKVPVCVYSNDNRNWPVFEQLAIPVARHLPDKTDPRGFDVAMQLHLQTMKHGTKLIHAPEVAVVGNNRITNGGCRKIGMQFIHVQHRGGYEKKLSKLVRLMGESIAGFHRLLEKTGQMVTGPRHPPIEKETPNPLVKALYEKRIRRPQP